MQVLDVFQLNYLANFCAHDIKVLKFITFYLLTFLFSQQKLHTKVQSILTPNFYQGRAKLHNFTQHPSSNFQQWYPTTARTLKAGGAVLFIAGWNEQVCFLNPEKNKFVQIHLVVFREKRTPISKK